MTSRIMLGIAVVAFLGLPVHAQECMSYCQVYFSCDTPCSNCVIWDIDYCQQWEESTCGQSGSCGGCAVTNQWSDTQTYITGTDPQPYCMYYRYWYGWDNWSEYIRHYTQTVTTTYTTTTCAGVSTTTSQSTTTYGDCFEFYQGECQWYDEYPVPEKVNGREC